MYRDLMRRKARRHSRRTRAAEFLCKRFNGENPRTEAVSGRKRYNSRGRVSLYFSIGADRAVCSQRGIAQHFPASSAPTSCIRKRKSPKDNVRHPHESPKRKSVKEYVAIMAATPHQHSSAIVRLRKVIRVTMKLDLFPKPMKVNASAMQPWMTWLVTTFFFASLWYGMCLVVQFISSLD